MLTTQWIQMQLINEQHAHRKDADIWNLSQYSAAEPLHNPSLNLGGGTGRDGT